MEQRAFHENKRTDLSSDWTKHLNRYHRTWVWVRAHVLKHTKVITGFVKKSFFSCFWFLLHTVGKGLFHVLLLCWHSLLLCPHYGKIPQKKAAEDNVWAELQSERAAVLAFYHICLQHSGLTCSNFVCLFLPLFKSHRQPPGTGGAT